ncbi:MAG TPA: hypothetical protein VFQ60_01170 [Patescibacteria group bacterium]|nr:hypothetical protein [Patescibacteria group bacterium]
MCSDHHPFAGVEGAAAAESRIALALATADPPHVRGPRDGGWEDRLELRAC